MDLYGRLRGSSLLARFAAASLVLTVAVGLVLSSVLSDLVTDRARQKAESAVVLAVRLGLQPQLRPTDFADGFDPARLEHVEAALHNEVGTEVDSLDVLDPVTIKMFSRDGLLVYSDQRQLVGKQVDSPDLRAALAGRVLSKFTSPRLEEEGSGGRDTRLLEVYVPVRYAGSPTTAGVMEVYIPYEPIAAAARADVRTLNLVLVASLAGLYLGLFRLVASASRRLIRQTEALQASADRNEHQATHDALTGTPNRTLFRDRVDTALANSRRTQEELAVMLLDLDRFKEINDTLGHTYGDALLRQIGPRLRSVLREGDTVARLGGDEFAVLLPTVEDEDEARSVAARMLEALHRSFEVDDVVLDVEASIGIARSPWHGTNTEDLLRNADIAMSVAKELKAGAVVFDPEEHVTAPLRLSVLGDLRRALDNGDELVLHYQPKYTVDGAEIQGVEALLRWRHPEHGLIPPGEFIPVAEGTGIIGPLTERVLGLALAQVRAWLDAGHRVPVAVNLSARSLLDAQLPSMVDRLLRPRGPARAAASRGHRDRGHGGHRPRHGRTAPAAHARSAPVDRRLRHRLHLDGPPAAAAGRRAEDRPLVRHRDDRHRAGRRPRAHRRRSRAQPGDDRGGRRCGDRRTPAGAGRPGLRRRAGLLLRPAHAGRRADRPPGQPGGG